MTIQAIFFDVGETLVNEQRYWEGWAVYLGVPVAELIFVLHEVIRRGEHHHAAFRYFRKNFNLNDAQAERRKIGQQWNVEKKDLYPDALPCLKKLRERGIKTGISGNQPIATEKLLVGLGFKPDYLGSSEGWGVEKPSPEFFDKIIELTELPPNHIAYVGDRLDNDIIPARKAGMKTVFIKRGPWGLLQSQDSGNNQSDIVINGLMDIFPALGRL